jgi:DNA-directed RNA polymerase sigma subunit (sigma70/sigma32)
MKVKPKSITTNQIKDSITRHYHPLSREEVTCLSNDVQAGIKLLLELGHQNTFRGHSMEFIKSNPVLLKAFKSREKLYLGNTPLVLHYMNKHYKGNDMEKAVQEGFLSLMRACELFDASKGFTFSTYACWWFQQANTKILFEELGSIRVNATVYSLRYKITELKKQREANDLPKLSLSGIAKELNTTVKKVKYSMNIPIEISADEELKGVDDVFTKLDNIPCNDSKDDSILYEYDLRNVSFLHKKLYGHLIAKIMSKEALTPEEEVLVRSLNRQITKYVN